MIRALCRALARRRAGLQPLLETHRVVDHFAERRFEFCVIPLATLDVMLTTLRATHSATSSAIMKAVRLARVDFIADGENGTRNTPRNRVGRALTRSGSGKAIGGKESAALADSDAEPSPHGVTLGTDDGVPTS